MQLRAQFRLYFAGNVPFCDLFFKQNLAILFVSRPKRICRIGNSDGVFVDNAATSCWCIIVGKLLDSLVNWVYTVLRFSGSF